MLCCRMDVFDKLTICVCFISITFSYSVCGQTVYHSLKTSLLQNYDPEVRPISKEKDDLIYIQTVFYIQAISDLKEGLEQLGTYGWLRLEWQDPLLTWNSSDFDYVSSILLRQSKIWTPDIIIENSVASEGRLGNEKMMVRIHSDGRVIWKPSGLYWTSCVLDIQLYPFDTQTCTISFTTEVSSSSEILFNTSSTTFCLDEYQIHGQWDLINTTFETFVKNGVSKVDFDLVLKRRSLYYVNFLVYPILSLSILTVMVFYLPAAGGEKLSLATSVMLSFVVFLTIFADRMPKSSLQTSLFVVYVSVLVGLSVWSVILSTIATNWYLKDPEVPVPRYLQFLASINKKKKRNRVESKESDQDKEPENRQPSWVEVSMGLDRLCLISYLFITLVFPLISFAFLLS